MLPNELCFKILSKCKLSLNLFLVCKSFNELCLIVFEKDKRYATEKILVEFFCYPYNGYTIHDNERKSEYRFVSWNEFRLYYSSSLYISPGYYMSTTGVFIRKA